MAGICPGWYVAALRASVAAVHSRASGQRSHGGVGGGRRAAERKTAPSPVGPLSLMAVVLQPCRV